MSAIKEERQRREQFIAEFRYPLEMDVISSNIGHSVKPINVHPFNYLHTDKRYCRHGDTSSIIILVKSTAHNFARRQAIRETWGKDASQYRIGVVFMLGFIKEIQYLIDEESAVHQDIVQEDFEDSYRNNTYKTIMMFNWTATYCKTQTIAFFIDDDQYINIRKLTNFLESTEIDKNKLLTGTATSFGQPYRDKSSKWYVSRDEYPFDYWPPYLAGGAILASISVVKNMTSLFPYVKYLSIDDVYLGIVAKKLGIELIHNTLMSNRGKRIKLLPLLIANHGYAEPRDFYSANAYLSKHIDDIYS
ncbi:hypothetical protein FSP39_015065 [Pinctada imbricata]|uniref:Hexosyltransferase n=1 Tax=Pinctada imbricata TaxID=66713 RepID=A0AA89C866_PINIB|nr:hypothetical protein FSP39_015065 [Pinctada imbricata]